MNWFIIILVWFGVCHLMAIDKKEVDNEEIEIDI